VEKIMPNTAGQHSSGMAGATAGATVGAAFGVPGAIVGGVIGGIGGWLLGKSRDTKKDRRDKRIVGELGDMQNTLRGRVPEILEYYANLESQSMAQDELTSKSMVDEFITGSNQLFNSGQQAVQQGNLAFGGSLAKDMADNWDNMFDKYKTQRGLQDITQSRDMASINLSKTESVEKVDDLISSLEIDKLELS
jgi:hypothetical protein